MEFYKYQGTGNDFIIIDDRNAVFSHKSKEDIARLCNRKFGIGADGLILLQNDAEQDFRMVYFNADGNEGSMCGNGGRCIAALAAKLGIITGKTTFTAIDGIHSAIITGAEVSLSMQHVTEIENYPDHCFINTGSPHYVTIVDELAGFDVVGEGRKIRNSERFRDKGTNVNFLRPEGNSVSVRTYERGVEDETLSCGTGVTACAIFAALKGLTGDQDFCKINTRGGQLTVRFRKVTENRFEDIWLVGPATLVFKGTIDA